MARRWRVWRQARLRSKSRTRWSELSPEGLRAEIAHLYRQIVEAHAVQLGQLYHAIAEGEAPLIIHCTAGKDRTGLAIAVLLELAGAARELVVWDYEQTNRHLKRDLIDLGTMLGAGASWGVTALAAECRDLLLGVDRAYLLGALQDLDTRFGSVEGFARDRLAMSDPALRRLRERLVEAT